MFKIENFSNEEIEKFIKNIHYLYDDRWRSTTAACHLIDFENALNQLPEKQKQVVIYRCVFCFKFEEISKMMAASTTTIYYHMQKAIKTLVKIYQNQQQEEDATDDNESR